MILYKYMQWPSKGTNHARELIRSDEIYLSRPKEFNDPYDVGILPVIEGDRDEIVDKLVAEKLRAFSDGEARKFFGRLYREEIGHWSSKDIRLACSNFIKWRRATTAVICFTDSPTNMLMWAHYADSHKGICLEFDTNKNLENPNIFETIYPVEYVDSYPKINFMEERERDFYRKIYSTKFGVWNYEHEYRAIYRCKERQDEESQTDLQVMSDMIGGCKISSENVDEKCKISPQAITSVICGCQMPLKQIDEVKETIWQHQSTIRMKRAIRKPLDFEINIVTFV